MKSNKVKLKIDEDAKRIFESHSYNKLKLLNEAIKLFTDQTDECLLYTTDAADYIQLVNPGASHHHHK